MVGDDKFKACFSRHSQGRLRAFAFAELESFCCFYCGLCFCLTIYCNVWINFVDWPMIINYLFRQAYGWTLCWQTNLLYEAKSLHTTCFNNVVRCIVVYLLFACRSVFILFGWCQYGLESFDCPFEFLMVATCNHFSYCNFLYAIVNS